MSIIKGLVCFVVLATASAGFVTHARAQARPSPKTQVVSVDPLGAALNDAIMFQYEWKVGPIYSWALRALYWPAPDNGGYSWSAFGVGGAYRVYIADSRALTGLSVAPAVEMYFFRGTQGGGSSKSGIAVWVGGDIGYKWIFDEFSVEPLLGIRVAFGPSSGTSGGSAVPSYATGFKAIIGLFGGYAW